MSFYKTAEQIALEWLVEQVHNGMEFPEAHFKACKKFSMDPESLRDAYDALPTRSEIQQAFRLMEQQGGGFASLLARAWFVADSDNQGKIEKNWEDLIRKYLPTREGAKS